MANLVRQGKMKIFYHFFFFCPKYFVQCWNRVFFHCRRKVSPSQNVPTWCLLSEHAKQTLVFWFYNLNPSCSLKYPSVFIPSQNLVISVMVGQSLLAWKWNTYCHIVCIQELSCLFWKTIICSTGSLVSSLPVLFTVLIWIFYMETDFFNMACWNRMMGNSFKLKEERFSQGHYDSSRLFPFYPYHRSLPF